MPAPEPIRFHRAATVSASCRAAGRGPNCSEARSGHDVSPRGAGVPAMPASAISSVALPAAPKSGPPIASNAEGASCDDTRHEITFRTEVAKCGPGLDEIAVTGSRQRGHADGIHLAVGDDEHTDRRSRSAAPGDPESSSAGRSLPGADRSPADPARTTLRFHRSIRSSIASVEPRFDRAYGGTLFQDEDSIVRRWNRSRLSFRIDVLVETDIGDERAALGQRGGQIRRGLRAMRRPRVGRR